MTMKLSEIIKSVPIVNVTGSATAKIHKILCPYCAKGFINIVEPLGDNDAKRDAMKELLGTFKEPRKCPSCGRYFRLKLSMKIIGFPLEG